MIIAILGEDMAGVVVVVVEAGAGSGSEEGGTDGTLPSVGVSFIPFFLLS